MISGPPIGQCSAASSSTVRLIPLRQLASQNQPHEPRNAPDRQQRRILRLYLTAWAMDTCTIWRPSRSELVTNGVRHCPDRCAAVQILRLPQERGLRVEVTDTGPRPPVPTTVDGLSEFAEGGRGVGIVEAVADRWRWVPLSDGPGKNAWSSATAGRGTT
ncbi:ATP-binding protein [Streptomyces griseorubiginosus]|uniref:ATP-binding protein n=1 Tax=Streptomyces griseorubiginosus TaxID=67304 RepID=UPI003F5425DE